MFFPKYATPSCAVASMKKGGNKRKRKYCFQPVAFRHRPNQRVYFQDNKKCKAYRWHLFQVPL